MENILISVVIPAYDEEENLKPTLEEISGYFEKRQYEYEVIIVDDGSRDDTIKIAFSCADLFKNFKVLPNDINRGKGYSIRKGIMEAAGKYALFMDADNSTSIYEFDKFLPCFKEGYDVVIASRRLKGSLVTESQPALRIVMGQFYIFLSRVILNLSVRDFNCGFKAYTNNSAKTLFAKQLMNDWSFDTEVLFLIKKYGFKIKEAPVKWVHKSTSKVKPLRDGIRSFLSLVKIKLNDMRHLYG